MIKVSDNKNIKLDLATARVLTVGERVAEQDILAQMLMGFGVSHIQRRGNAEEAISCLSTEVFDLAFVDARLKEVDGYDLIRNVRRHPLQTVCQLPIILVQGHVRASHVFKARDCGAHYVLSKPFSPQICFDRIYYLAKDQRPFIDCPTYVGPDRRVKVFGPPAGMPGRRAGDLSGEVGEAKEANLSQDVVDSFFEPKKVVA